MFTPFIIHGNFHKTGPNQRIKEPVCLSPRNPISEMMIEDWPQMRWCQGDEDDDSCDSRDDTKCWQSTDGFMQSKTCIIISDAPKIADVLQWKDDYWMKCLKIHITCPLLNLLIHNILRNQAHATRWMENFLFPPCIDTFFCATKLLCKTDNRNSLKKSAESIFNQSLNFLNVNSLLNSRVV